jgi:hypothetical protein
MICKVCFEKKRRLLFYREENTLNNGVRSKFSDKNRGIVGKKTSKNVVFPAPKSIIFLLK